MGKNLRSFLREVIESRPSDIYVVQKQVDPRFEMIAYVERFENEKQTPVLFFKHVKGTGVPVIVNLLASFDRLALALGCRSRRDAVLEFARRADNPVSPRKVTGGPVKEVVIKGEDAKLSLLPQITHNERDGGPYICSAVTVIKDPDSDVHNTGIYRNQIKDNRLGLMINPANHGSYIMNRYRELREPMEVALVIGHHPAFLLAAGGARLPRIGGEYELAGGLMREPLQLVKGETVDLYYPADAEIVIEGVVDDVGKLEEEGNFGEYPRYYSGKKQVPFIRITAICMRRDAIYQDIAAAHDEHIVMGSLPRMATYLQSIKANAPYVQMVNLPKSASSRAHIYVSIKKRNEGEGKQAGIAALAADPNIKMAVVVDDDIDVFDEEQVLWAVAFRFEADRDLVVIPYTLGAHLNPSAYDLERTKKGVLQSRIIIDATWPLRGFEKVPVARAPKEIYEKVSLEDCSNELDDALLKRIEKMDNITK